MASVPLPEVATVRYVIDAKGSTFIIQASSTGLLSAFGHDPRMAIRDFQGDVEFSPGVATLDEARLQLRIRADSLEVVNDIKDKDRAEIQRRASEEVLESHRFPDICYDCFRVTGSGAGQRYWLSLNGELTLRGVTRPFPITARLLVNGNSIRASGEFSVRQHEFEIPPVTAVGGAIRLKDELKCTFDVIARKQEKSDGSRKPR